MFLFSRRCLRHTLECDRLDLCGALRPASSRNPIPVDSRRFPSTRHWGGSARRGRASGAACERGRVREETNRQESTGIDRSRVCPCGAKRTRATAQGRERVDSGAARREGPRTNGKSKCSETRPMGAGRKCAEESAAFEGKARSAAKPAARTRTNRIGRALRVAMPPAERFNTFKSHPRCVQPFSAECSTGAFMVKCPRSQRTD